MLHPAWKICNLLNSLYHHDKRNSIFPIKLEYINAAVLRVIMMVDSLTDLFIDLMPPLMEGLLEACDNFIVNVIKI